VEVFTGEMEAALFFWDCWIDSLHIFIASHINAEEFPSEEFLLSFFDFGVLNDTSTVQGNIQIIKGTRH
jgi:hypothetical protein